MARRDSMLIRFFRELRRRRVFRTAALYVVGAWLVMQAADVFFPGWGLPDAAINILLVAAILGFPLALVFGWFFDVTMHGIVRTPSAEEGSEPRSSLQRTDYLVLGGLVLFAGFIVYDAAQEIIETPRVALPDGEELTELVTLDKPPNSIAVLPFVNISNDPDNEAFCDGISEEILNKLGAFADLQVIGRTSSFAFKGSGYRIPKISGLLGVRYLLQGSVRKHGNQLRISAQLVDDSGTQRWSDTFDRTLENIFAIQTEIADVVATTVVPRIAHHSAASYEPDIAAYQHFLVGRELVRRRESRAARDEIGKAIRLDPGFAEAHAELAIALLLGNLDDQVFVQATQAIDTALMLQPELPRALAARGLLLQQQVPPDWAAAESVLREVLAGDPNMVDALNWLSNPLAARGATKSERDAVLERALRLDPLNPTIVVNMAGRYADRGQIDRAEEMVLRLLELPDPSWRGFGFLRDLYRDTGQLVKMNAIAKRMALTISHVYFGLQFNYALLGLWQVAEDWVERTNRDFPDHYYGGYNKANVPAWRGDYAEAVRLFEHALASRGGTLESLNRYYSHDLGINQALAGEHADAVDTLQGLYGDGIDGLRLETHETDGPLALAWSYLQLGMADQARLVLASIERQLEELLNADLSPNSGLWYWSAGNALLMGDQELALDRLEQAVRAGWRDFYIRQHDPRWAALKDNPRYQALMAEVKADVDRQRAEVEHIDAQEDFPALLDRVRAARQ
jgi:TolB-like protein